MRFWASEQCHCFAEKPLHSEKITVWCAMLSYVRRADILKTSYITELTLQTKPGYFRKLTNLGFNLKTAARQNLRLLTKHVKVSVLIEEHKTMLKRH